MKRKKPALEARKESAARGRAIVARNKRLRSREIDEMVTAALARGVDATPAALTRDMPALSYYQAWRSLRRLKQPADG